ncbi:hypothetical protein B9G69_011285 [Bdellovibrio sp. SKB1291214]|uniref:hypothetical protein n=1 Tax=Bdellovibrio sp. SKB1291214 TaxID=1732569 RepID=UPI000B518A6F|nr:hypothetical protein [Bdellovibrio sp. SKB1291214]UYL07629.1 hypothetical protein B9G69_011285 [Bdellovibrio sp. SKB1291214]
MKSVLVASLLLFATSAQASFLCTSKEVRDDGKPAYGMTVNEFETVNTHVQIAIWATGHASQADQFECIRESMEYGNGRTAQYKCEANGDKTLQVYAQRSGAKITATADLKSSAGQFLLSNMLCKTIE